LAANGLRYWRWGGRGLCLGAKKLEAKKMLEKAAESPASGARCVTKMKQVGRPLRYAAGWYGGWYPVKQFDTSPGMPTGAHRPDVLREEHLGRPTPPMREKS
jgi:hypothetical protein